ncbi:MAG: PepSY-associated TM helix domain-containing protein [Pseudomonadales bacterium]
MRSDVAMPQQARTTSALYRTLWRWHFYAGVLCVPVLISLGITGAIYLFKPDVERARIAAYADLTPGDARAPANAQIALALNTLPDARFIEYRVPESDNDAPVITVLAGGARHAVAIDPWRLSVIEVRNLDQEIMQTVRSLHGELLSGDAGSIVVELVGSWAIVLLLTGLYLAWPADTRRLATMLWPPANRPEPSSAKRAASTISSRTRWRDWHAAIGLWISLLVLFLLITGLPWSIVWGGAFKEARAWAGSFGEPTWSSGRSAEIRVWQRRAVERVNLPDRLVEAARRLDFAPPATLAPQPGSEGAWSLASDHPNRMLRETALLDPTTGLVLARRNFADQGLLDRAIGIGISAHEGALFGRANQVLGLMAALGPIALAARGTVMWLKRRPIGILGAPPAPTGRRWFPTLVLVLACILPLIAASLVALWLLEQVFRRIPPAARWLGLAH